MYQKVTQDGMTNVADRYEAQDKVRCHAFCAKGLSLPALQQRLLPDYSGQD